MNYWIVATYKINESKILKTNLKNQEFEFYLPQIVIKKNNLLLKEELIFPGYIFIKTAFKNYSTLKYTRGIKNVIKFGENIACISEHEIKTIKMIEKESRINPMRSSIHIGDEATISNGPFEGALVKICSLPSNKRVDIFLSILGSKRRINILEKDLSL